MRSASYKDANTSVPAKTASFLWGLFRWHCFVNPFAGRTFLGGTWWWSGCVWGCKECESTNSHAVKTVSQCEK
jgi:hypothetical protein